MPPLTLTDLAALVGGELYDAPADPPADATVTGPVTIDRRQVTPGGVFAAFVGEHTDGHEYAAAAVERGSTIEVRTGDGRDYGAEEPGTYDRVLVDAPCTGLGALRRRPEARWRRQPGDLTALGPLQRDLLRSALDATAPGGVVGYATCSPHLAETSFVVRDVVKRRDDVEILDARPFFTQASNGALIDLGNGPFVQLWPHVHGTDGMFFALLRRR